MHKSLNEILGEEKEISYEECQNLWEDAETLVHHDTSLKLIKEISEHIIDRCCLTKDDVLLNVGCGDGLFDSLIAEYVKGFYGIDFSNQKLSIAKSNVKSGHYYQQSFLDKYCDALYLAKPTKIYSYSVAQYCKPADLDTFIYNQLCLCTENREYVIAHLDIPDKEKAVYYYQKQNPEITKEMLDGNVKTLFGDGSYWHDMGDFEQIAKKYGLECEITDAHYWKYRTDVIYRFNGREW